MDSITPKDFADAVGRKTIARTLGVGAAAVSNAIVRGQFPPSWFVALSALSAEKGMDCPAEIFGMKAAERGDAA